MPTEPTLEQRTAQDKHEEIDDGEESDVYEIEGEEEGDAYQPDEDEDDEGDQGANDVEPENMTALLLGKQNGTTRPEEYDDDDDNEDEEYQEDGEGTAENPIDLSEAVLGSKKRGVDELAEEDADGDDEGDEGEGETATKKPRV